MSAYQPGMANSTTPIFEPDTGIINVTPTLVSFPDVIPVFPAETAYQIFPAGSSSGQARSFGVSGGVIISATGVGNGKAVLQFRLGGLATSNPNDYLFQYVVGPALDSDLPTLFSVTFTGLVATLPTSPLSLYVSSIADTDTTVYSVTNMNINLKRL
jgi:hypothetical protein